MAILSSRVPFISFAVLWSTAKPPSSCLQRPQRTPNRNSLIRTKDDQSLPSFESWTRTAEVTGRTKRTELPVTWSRNRLSSDVLARVAPTSAGRGVSCRALRLRVGASQLSGSAGTAGGRQGRRAQRRSRPRDTACGRVALAGVRSLASPAELRDGLRQQRGRLEVPGEARAAQIAARPRRAMDAQRAEVRALEAEIAALRRACEEPRAAGEYGWRARYVPPQALGASEGLRRPCTPDVSRAPRAQLSTSGRRRSRVLGWRRREDVLAVSFADSGAGGCAASRRV